MSQKDVPQAEWAATLEAFGRDHRAWLATVEHVGHDGRRDVWLPDRPLAGVFAERQPAGMAVRIELASATSPSGPSVRIGAPVAVRVEHARDGSTSAMEIDDREGGRTRVRFRVDQPPDMLDGVAPGEL